MIIYVESNFVLELTFMQEQHEDCSKILELAKSGSIKLVVPAYSFAECYERMGRRKGQRIHIQSTLREEIREIGRSEHLSEASEQLRTLTQFLVESAESDREKLDELIATLLSVAELIPMDADIIRSSVNIRDSLGLSQQDSIILASVLSHLEQTNPESAVFVNKNRKDFEDPDVKTRLAALHCDLKTEFRGGLAFIESCLRRTI